MIFRCAALLLVELGATLTLLPPRHSASFTSLLSTILLLAISTLLVIFNSH